MAKAPHVKFDTPPALENSALELLTEVKEVGKLKKGINETTKSVERGVALLVFISEDIDPPEIAMHLPVLCDEKKVPYLYVKKQEDLGKACGLGVGCSSVALVDSGKARGTMDEILKGLTKARKGEGN
ncbi:MAG: 50S ribosomal protein L7ae [Euryarchaeota archaeon]|nr:50S ribosomal protein L7ae [Euryarchaeota archaeon]